MRILNWHRRLRQQAKGIEACLDGHWFRKGDRPGISFGLLEKTEDGRAGRHLELQLSFDEAKELVTKLSGRLEEAARNANGNSTGQEAR